MKPTQKTRKPIDKLSLADISAFPIWEFATDEEGIAGQDETWVRPLPAREVPLGAYSLSVAAEFEAPTGATLRGIVSINTAAGYAATDNGARWTGRQALFVDDHRLGAVPRLAICRNLFGELKDYLIFHCDSKWNVLAIAGAPTFRECKLRAGRWYEGLSKHWVRTNVTKRSAERWLRTHYANSMCSVCHRLPAEADGMFSKRNVNVCFVCVREMHRSIVASQGENGA